MIDFRGETLLPVEPDRVLEKAVGQLVQAVVIGRHKDGSFYIASSESYGPNIMWLLELAKKRLVEAVHE